MAGGFSSQILDEIRSRVDIVEIVGQFVNLKRAGEHWKGLCPFHSEKTPSFTVNPKRGIFHCFGCGVGGDAFGFLMRQDRLAFPEAVRALARRSGVELPTQRTPEVEGKLEGLRRVMTLAAQFYTDALWAKDGARARAYVESRGVDLDVARRFGLGYAPEGWNALLTHMAKEGVTDSELVAAGLALPRQNAPGFYDRFRGRLLFPIRDLQGRVVAFGGRAMGAEEPKYLNSPETALYVKGRCSTPWRSRGRACARRTARWWSKATSTASWPISTASRRRWPPSGPPSRPPSLACCAAMRTKW
jgi:DNA primase (bacterial type)